MGKYPKHAFSFLRLFAIFCLNPRWISLAFTCLKACSSHACNTQQGFSWKISGLCISSSAKFCFAFFLHHPFGYLLCASSANQCYGCFCKDNQLFFLLALGTLLFLCSWYPRSAAFSDCAIVLVNLEVKSSKAVSWWILLGSFLFCRRDTSYSAANPPRMKHAGIWRDAISWRVDFFNKMMRRRRRIITEFIRGDGGSPKELHIWTRFVNELWLKEHYQAF